MYSRQGSLAPAQLNADAPLAGVRSVAALQGECQSVVDCLGACLRGGAMCQDVLDLHAVEQELQPGDVLFAQSSVGHYAYVVQRGLLQRVHADDIQGAHDAAPGLTVQFAGVGDLVGMCRPRDRRNETVTAVTPTRLLAIEVNALQGFDSASSSDALAISRLRSAALKRDWRIAYQLRDLNDHARVVAGLAYLVRSSNRDLPGGLTADSVPVHLDVSLLSQWLGLPQAATSDALDALVARGALKRGGSRVTSWVPVAVADTAHEAVACAQ